MLKKGLQVKEVMSEPGVWINKDEIVGEALELMDRREITHLLVMDRDRGLVGILTARGIMEGLGSYRFQKIRARRIHVSALMIEPPTVIEPDAEVTEAVKLMLSKEIEVIPVVKGSEVLGVISETDVIRLLNGEMRERVEDLMNPKHPRIDPGQRIVHARTVLLETKSRILPVCIINRLVGTITEMILAKAFYQVRENFPSRLMDSVVRRVIVEDVMLENPPTLLASDDFKAMIGKIVEKGFPAIPVVGPGGVFLGVLERKTILNRFLT